MAGKFPPHGFIGIALIVSFWLLNWTLTGLRTHWAFFPLWLGYIFFVDALAVKRGRSSLVTRRPAGFVGLFLISAPIWWIFEFLNRWTNYWVYKPVESFTNFEYHAYCTLSFSTVVPAVFVTAQCLASFRFFQVDHIRINVGSGLVSQLVCLALGSLMLAAVFLIPEISMAFLWISLFLILDPINLWVGNPSVLAGTSHGDWRLALIFMAAPFPSPEEFLFLDDASGAVISSTSSVSANNWLYWSVTAKSACC